MTNEELVKRTCDYEPEAFEAFWKAYPLKACKVRAMREWDRLKLPKSEFADVARFVEAYGTCSSSGPRACGNEAARVYYCAGNGNLVFADVFLCDQPWVL